MTRDEKAELLNELLKFEEKNDIGNLTSSDRAEFQMWIKEALQQEPCDKCVYSTSEGCQYDDITEAMPPVSSSEKPNKCESEHDHEILRAYSDGASAVLDEIRAEIEERKKNSGGEPNRDIAFNVCLRIIDSYKAEGSGE